MKYQDPMKVLNDEYYLNDVALKTRYNLLQINQQNEKEKVDRGTHWKKFTPYPLIDEDIKYNLYIQGNKPIEKIIKNNEKIISNIDKSGLKKILNSIDHTSSLSNELSKERNRRKHHHKTKTEFFFNSNPYLTSGHNTFRLYKKTPLKTDNIPFVTNLNDINIKKKRIIYDISPINTKRKKGRCIFPNVNSTQNSYEKTYQDNFKIDFSKNEDNNNERILTDFSDNNYYSQSNKEKKFTIRIMKAKGEPHKIKLKDLAQDLETLTQDDFNNKNKGKNKMLLYSKKIIVIDPDKNKKKNNTQLKSTPKYKEFKYFDEVEVKKGAFPKSKYFMNFQYDNGAVRINKNNDKMDEIQGDITVKFNDMKHFVSTNIDQTLKTLEK